ncbi:MAG TPA: APC family permease [Hyphomicrobiaceae bacterium]|nr:APC family permease [Hyphomicrobiaceae bacterium]
MSEQRVEVSAFATAPSVPLKRSLSLLQATLYGLGVTIGAGIYVLIGAAAARAGMHAPVAFGLAAVLMALTAASFAELAGRMPVAAGEAAYVRDAFQSNKLALLVGLLVVAVAVVSAAAISVGSAGYIGVFIQWPEVLLIALVVLAMGAIAGWGIKESVIFAGVMTLIEVGGLLLLILAGMASGPELITRLPEAVPPLGNAAVVAGLMGTAMLAVFAFIGFESLANVAEEVRDPQRTLPRAIFLTLALSTLLYVLVVWVALVAVPHEELAQSKAPLALVFERLTGASARTMSLIAIVATLNGIIVQIIMASRVLYGLARQSELPAFFAEVNGATRTPLNATAVTTLLVLLFAVLLPLHHLADITSRITLVVFALVNLALIRIKARAKPVPSGTYIAPAWIPWAALATCAGLLIVDMILLARAMLVG